MRAAAYRYFRTHATLSFTRSLCAPPPPHATDYFAEFHDVIDEYTALRRH